MKWFAAPWRRKLVVQITYTKGSATTYVPDDSTLNELSLASNGTLVLDVKQKTT